MTMTNGTTTLFCIPHAGGSAAYYAPFGQFFPQSVSFRPLELPGRGRRHREPLQPCLHAIRRDLFSSILPVAEHAPYALFGHSMGALLAFLCTLEAREQSVPLPAALFLSGCATPGSPEHTPPAPVASLSPAMLWQHVLTLGGVPECVAASEEFCRYMQPILHADFTALEQWQPAPAAPVPVPIIIFLGDRDIITEQAARQWRRQTCGAFSLRTFPGNHFYLQEHWAELAAHITGTLLPA